MSTKTTSFSGLLINISETFQLFDVSPRQTFSMGNLQLNQYFFLYYNQYFRIAKTSFSSTATYFQLEWASIVLDEAEALRLFSTLQRNVRCVVLWAMESPLHRQFCRRFSMFYNPEGKGLHSTISISFRHSVLCNLLVSSRVLQRISEQERKQPLTCY